MASKLKLCLSAIEGTMLVGLAEGMALGNKAGFSSELLMEILGKTQISCPLFLEKSKGMI